MRYTKKNQEYAEKMQDLDRNLRFLLVGQELDNYKGFLRTLSQKMRSGLSTPGAYKQLNNYYEGRLTLREESITKACSYSAKNVEGCKSNGLTIMTLDEMISSEKKSSKNF